MTTPKQHLQAALDAITYNASINQVFANGEFQSIKADLDAVMDFLNEQDESCAAVYQQYRDIGEKVVTNALLGSEPKDATSLLLDELNAMSVDEFEDGAAFEEFPAAEFIEETQAEEPAPKALPDIGWLTQVDETCAHWVTNGKKYSCLYHTELVETLPTLIGKLVGFGYDKHQTLIIYVTELPF